METPQTWERGMKRFRFETNTMSTTSCNRYHGISVMLFLFYRMLLRP